MNLVFDFGAVVFRWQPEEFLQRLLPTRAPNEAAAKELGARFFQSFGGDWAEFDRGRLTTADITRRTAERLAIPLDEVQRVVAAIPNELQPLPQTVALLQRLRTRGHRLFYLSNMPAPYASHLEAAHPLLGWFEAGVFSSRVDVVKPEPEIFRLAEERFGLPGSALFFIDDVAKNVAAARAAGWHAHHYTEAAMLERELVDLGAL